jgi:CelD/BcsL family acetyltransferase involved in cellulose biosynthesis
MQTQVYTDVAGFDSLAGEWNQLLHRSSCDTIFMTHEWQRTWWTQLGTGNPCLVAVRDDGGSLVGIASLYSDCRPQGRTLSFVGCTDVSDYLDVIVAPGYEVPVYVAVLDALDSNGTGWQQMELCNIRANSPTLSVFRELAESRGYHTAVEREDVCPIIRLPGDWEAYLASLDKKQRHEIRRKMRKAETEADTRWYIVDDGRNLAREMDTFIELHQRSSREKDDFMDASMRRFFHAIAETLFPRNWLQLAFIEINGEKAASVLNFDYGNNILVYNSGYDPDKYTQLSPGIVLLSYTIQHAIALSRTEFDFLRGDEEYKYRFGATNTEIFRLTVDRGA